MITIEICMGIILFLIGVIIGFLSGFIIGTTTSKQTVIIQKINDSNPIKSNKKSTREAAESGLGSSWLSGLINKRNLKTGNSKENFKAESKSKKYLSIDDGHEIGLMEQLNIDL